MTAEEEGKSAWTDQSEAVYVAILSQLEELPDYGHRMNVITNALRVIMTKEVAEQIMEVTGLPFAELGHIVIGLELLVKDFTSIMEKMPKHVKDVIHTEAGCGHCEICKAARRDVGAQGETVIRPRKDESRAAVERLIATMLGGGKPN